ncbi:MAG: GAF domain-containing protein [Deltaproteobacteria bacterium]|nr:GAF domain-containing protein [Deltaproteobacteria bacterium]
MEKVKKLVGEVRSDPSKREEMFREVCRYVVEKVKSTRASVWSFNAAGTAIVCDCMLDDLEGKYSSGTRLNEDDFPQYFKAIKDDLKVVAPDARTHPATACFRDAYFDPLDIKSLLDFVVLAGKEPVGILCCEHCGEIKHWSAADADVLHQLSTVLGLVWRQKPRPSAGAAGL